MGLAVLDRQALPLNDALDIPGPSGGGCGLHGGVCPRKWPAKHPGVCCPFVEACKPTIVEPPCKQRPQGMAVLVAKISLSLASFSG